MKIIALSLAVPAVAAFQSPAARTQHTTTATSFKSTIGGNDEKPAAPMSPPAASSTTSSSSTTTPFEMPTSLQDVKLPSSLQDMKMPDLSSIDLKSIQEKLPDFSTVMESFQDGGEFGSRGELYVAGQAVLVIAVALGGGIPFLGGALQLSGPLLLLGGLAGVAVSLSDIGKSLSPFTTPNSKGDLVTTGLYQYVRHPMYTALIMTCMGFSIVTDSATRLILTALLVGVMNLKTNKEEEEMEKKFPEYASYKSKVSGKFFPLELIEETKNKFLN